MSRASKLSSLPPISAALAATVLGRTTPGVVLAQIASSDLPAIIASEIGTLPKGPLPANGKHDCKGNYPAPQTSAGRYVQNHGWGVMSEARIGDRQLVSFAGHFLAGTSSSGAIEKSNIGVLQGEALKAIFYAANEIDQMIGTLDERQSGNVRIWSGVFLSLPMADISRKGKTLLIGAVAAKESFAAPQSFPMFIASRSHKRVKRSQLRAGSLCRRGAKPSANRTVCTAWTSRS